MKNNDIKLDIHKSWYNKTVLQADGVTYLIDTSKQYPVYDVQLYKNYFDYENREDLISAIIADLEKTIDSLNKAREEKHDEINQER